MWKKTGGNIVICLFIFAKVLIYFFFFHFWLYVYCWWAILKKTSILICSSYYSMCNNFWTKVSETYLTYFQKKNCPKRLKSTEQILNLHLDLPRKKWEGVNRLKSPLLALKNSKKKSIYVYRNCQYFDNSKTNTRMPIPWRISRWLDLIIHARGGNIWNWYEIYAMPKHSELKSRQKVQK